MEPRGYAEDFDPDWYLENYIKTLNNKIDDKRIHSFAMDFLHDIFSTGNYCGKTLLDMGTGPSVYSVISASRHVQEIHLSDINARNREILQTWRDGIDNCREIFEYVCKKEGEGLTVEERSDEVRKKVLKILEADFREKIPLKDAEGTYDIITASLLLCSIAVTETEYTDLLKKIFVLLKPKGYLVVIGILNSADYQVGEYKFPGLKIEGTEMKNLFLKENLKILEWRETYYEAYTMDYANGSTSCEQGTFTMICQKA